MKTYRGSPAAARTYVESGRARADDYYLAEGTGVAERYVASRSAGVSNLPPLSGDAYEAWVAGSDPRTGEPKGRLRNDDNAVRFVEVTVNGPKSWSLAAALHPDISAAYDAAQDAAAAQIISWLADHATTRVGRRGAQIQVPITELEAVTVRHHTSRAGDPHRHLHLQINARVLADGQWRGLHTIGVRDSLDAINGIGHAAVITDPTFRTALAAHGYTVEPETGEIAQLSAFVGPFSTRATQISRTADRYEVGWRAANPGREPGPTLRQRWNACAWADGRPDKLAPLDGAELTRRWMSELHELGLDAPPSPAKITSTLVGIIDRDRAAAEVLTRLAARRSAWNTADIRGEVEQLITRADVVTTASVRCELAEDLTARAVAECVPLLERDDVPEHVRALTSRHVLGVEADITARLAARAATPQPSRLPTVLDARPDLDQGQQVAVQVLAGGGQLVLLEGAAGAGKTTTLAATRVALQQAGHRLVVVTPTRKAADVAGRELGTRAFSAAWLAYQHGFRWNDNGVWTRLVTGDTEPAGTIYTGPSERARLRAGDLLLIDEAGMLDQDTGHALLTIADQHSARLAFVGDTHQLPAVGRGGVLDLAARWVSPDAHLTLDTVHRFVRATTSPDGTTQRVRDNEYADLSLAMRTGEEPGDVFDALFARGRIRLHPNDQDRLEALVDEAAQDTSHTLVIADTREDVAALNAAIHERLLAAGDLDGNHTTSTSSGQEVAVGDTIVTRRNDASLDVANRELWTVTGISESDDLAVTSERGDRLLPAHYAQRHVQLGYASTVRGIQGETCTAAHASIGKHSTGASAYVAMTRGRETNTAHLVAETVPEAREEWIAVFERDRADRGPGAAEQAAANELQRYGPQPAWDATVLAADESVRRSGLLRQLDAAQTVQACAHEELAHEEHALRGLEQRVDTANTINANLTPLREQMDAAHANALDLTAAAAAARSTLDALAGAAAAETRRAWDSQLGDADEAAAVVRAGPGRFGLHRSRVNDCAAQLEEWAQQWTPVLGDDVQEIATRPAAFPSHIRQVSDAMDDHARCAVMSERPDLSVAIERAAHATDRARTASGAYEDALRHIGGAAALTQSAETERLPEYRNRVEDARRRVVNADARVEAIRSDPLITKRPGLRPDAGGRSTFHDDLPIGPAPARESALRGSNSHRDHDPRLDDLNRHRPTRSSISR